MNEKTWRTSSYSGNANNCVELAIRPSLIDVRDTKNRDGGSLAFGAARFGSFLAVVRSGGLSSGTR
ncbi:MAG TPA: DUF397 domain-containing protein [Pseudonocardiaceae bacterium]|jgi:hypothetical protein|nr:DUF397 domain-containing protein [Pseudonocardiaceae bacterium]